MDTLNPNSNPLDFHCLTLADRAAYQSVALGSGRRNCNFTFANLVGWQFWFQTELCLLPNAALLRFNLDGQRAYMICTPDVPPCDLLRALYRDAEGHFTLLGLEDEMAHALQQSACLAGINIAVEPCRNQYDYIYRRADLAALQGGKLKAKRNHVNKFLAEHPYFEYRPLVPAMFNECRQLEALWREERGDNNPTYGDTLMAEQRCMETIFAHWDALDMMGGSIFVDGRMVAFTYGAAVTNDTIDVMVEKADRTIDGAFNIINQQFCAHLPERFLYVNREEDMGLEGLRKSKLSYHPEILLSYNAIHIA